MKYEKDKKKIFTSILKVIILLLIIVAIPVYLVIYRWDIIVSLSSQDDVLALMESYKNQAVIIYVIVQIIQIVISIIPGQAFQFAAGYIFTLPEAFLLTSLGAILGTTVSYYLVKVLGRDFVYLMLGKEKTTYYIDRLNSKRAYTIVFLIYLIPGLPKDLVCYCAGISQMNFRAFLILSFIGRSLGFSGSILVGYFTRTENLALAGVIGVLAIITFLLCVFFRKHLVKYIDKFYERVVKEQSTQ